MCVWVRVFYIDRKIDFLMKYSKKLSMAKEKGLFKAKLVSNRCIDIEIDIKTNSNMLLKTFET